MGGLKPKYKYEYKQIVIPKSVYEKESDRYYVIADTVAEMCVVLDRTLPLNFEMINNLERTRKG